MKTAQIKQAKPYLNCSLGEMEDKFRDGAISEETLEAYRYLWTWCVPRFSGEADRAQSRYYAQYGLRKTRERINATRRMVGLADYYTPEQL